MDTKKLMVGTVAAFVASFFMGFLTYGVIFMDYMVENASQSAEGDIIYIALGHLILSFLIAYIFVNWATISTFMGGLKGGAIIGTLISLGIGFTFLGGSEIYTGMTPVFVDVLCGLLIWGVAGGAAGWAIGKWGQ
jgi:hypothetical protein